MNDDDDLLRSRSIRWVSDAELAEIARRADAELAELRTRLGWADRSLDDLARRLHDRVRKPGR